MTGLFQLSGNRMAVEDHKFYHEFHCGNCFEIEIQGVWHQVRIEHGQGGWYLIGLPPHFQNSAMRYAGHKARIQ